MIVSKQKRPKEILRALKEQRVFIIGCGKCATKLHVGGEPEVLEMRKRLRSKGKKITGSTVLSSACSISSWDEVLSQNPGIEKSDALLVMSCAAGVSVISALAEKCEVYPALDTESIGGAYGDKTIAEQCVLCGECNVFMYGGICPLANCAKGMLNGPCGGALEGKCEVDDRLCAWDAIYEKLKKLGKLEYLEITRPPKEYKR